MFRGECFFTMEQTKVERKLVGDFCCNSDFFAWNMLYGMF